MAEPLETKVRQLRSEYKDNTQNFTGTSTRNQSLKDQTLRHCVAGDDPTTACLWVTSNNTQPSSPTTVSQQRFRSNSGLGLRADPPSHSLFSVCVGGGRRRPTTRPPGGLAAPPGATQV